MLITLMVMKVVLIDLVLRIDLFPRPHYHTNSYNKYN